MDRTGNTGPCDVNDIDTGPLFARIPQHDMNRSEVSADHLAEPRRICPRAHDPTGTEAAYRANVVSR